MDRERPHDVHVEPLLGALRGQPTMSTDTSPSLALRLVIAAIIALGLLALVIKQAY